VNAADRLSDFSRRPVISLTGGPLLWQLLLQLALCALFAATVLEAVNEQ